MKKITRPTVAALVACAALVTGSAVVSQAHGATAPTVSTTTDAEQIDGIAVRAANEAVLAQLCHVGQSDATARAQFEATASAHPELAAQLDASCAPITPAP